MINALGESAYRDIHEGKRAPTYEEYLKFERCYGKVSGDSVTYITSNQTLPTPTNSCLKETLGDLYSKINSGQTLVPPELRSKVDRCFGVDPQPFKQGSVIKIPEGTKSCLKDSVGKQRFNEISSGNTPTNEEKTKANSCFNQLNAVQAKFIPPPPEQAHFLDEDDKTINFYDITQEKTEAEGKLLGGKIVLSGHSFANEVVTLYIFSEPIVVTTKTDENGDWTFELNEPLSGEKHIAYAAIRTSSGKLVRSTVFDFTVIAAEEDLANRFIDEEISTQPAQKSFLGPALIAMSIAFLVVGLIYVFYFQKNLKKVGALSETSGGKGNGETKTTSGPVN